ncbi:hypothetical protein EZV62_011591 [Acer yangbiense]|uniref:Uncharacterized protein n=1 Tax=Acer yangbiense TaxID=1000413 RepID=A0A5C7I5R9_9ROSI|nr:hypothetical protein EZV62_011591 [Acer yangbiense]
MLTNGWAKTCKIGINDVTVPNFESSILFPPRNISEDKLPPLSESKSDQMITKWFVFHAKTLSKLKADHQAAMRHNCKPLTNVILIAFLWRAQINATRARHGCFKSSLWSVIMNLRDQVRCAISNFIIEYAKVSTDDDEDGFFSKSSAVATQKPEKLANRNSPGIHVSSGIIKLSLPSDAKHARWIPC